MRQFIARHADRIAGVLSGFDRLIFRGYLRSLCYDRGVKNFLDSQGVLLKDFEGFVQTVTGIIKAAATGVVERLGRPAQYLNSSRISKEGVAQKVLAEQTVRSGPICLLSIVEPCQSWQVRRSRERQHPQELCRHLTKCTHLYSYCIDDDFGFCHVRVQTWLPYTVQVYVNGREWLARQLDRRGVSYHRVDNCFPYVADPVQAQEIFDEMRGLPWTRMLDAMVEQANPALRTIVDTLGAGYYWTVHQSEWASDIMFREGSYLASYYPDLVHYAMSHFGSRDVMRFLGKQLVSSYRGEVITDYKVRPEGMRVKHVVGANSIKMYDKGHAIEPGGGSSPAILRIETTMNDPSAFKTRRKAQGDPESKVKQRPLRKGIADIRRRARISQAANNCYADALASANSDAKVHDLIRPVAKAAHLNGRRVRPLRPWADPDLSLLKVVGQAEFLLQGFRNRDVVAAIFPASQVDAIARRKQSAMVSYLLRILRAHKVIRKVRGTHRYVVTAEGRRIITAAIATSNATLSKLQQCA